MAGLKIQDVDLLNIKEIALRKYVNKNLNASNAETYVSKCWTEAVLEFLGREKVLSIDEYGFSNDIEPQKIP